MRRLVLTLNAATVLLVIGGVALLLIPFSAPVVRTPAAVSLSAGAADGGKLPVADIGAADRVVRSNIFSSRRAAPAQRYSLGDLVSEPDALVDAGIAVSADPAMSDSTAASTVSDAVPHLYGTMLGSAESTALLRLDARVSEPRLFRAGDRAGGYRVVEIADRSVTLMGPSGRVVLRLPRPEP
jgi:hypothetical protein